MCERTPLSNEDQEALRRSTADLSDIPPLRLGQIDRGFRAAYLRAEEIRRGIRNPLGTE
jgi:hypothetical protein